MLEPNFGFQNKYWPILSAHLISKFGQIKVIESSDVQEVLVESFHFMIFKLESFLKQQKRASFVLFMNMIHENSIELYLKQIDGEKLTCNEETFAATRRVLKILLEQTTLQEWEGCPNFLEEASINIEHYTQVTEELLYLGYQTILISEFIARSKLFPDSIQVDLSNSIFTKLTIQPYPLLYEFVHKDQSRHNSHIALYNSFNLFKSTLENECGLKYEDLVAIMGKQIKDPTYKFKIFKLNVLIDEFVNEFSYDHHIVSSFFNGLKLSSLNCLTIEKSILNNQNLNRFIYRPILEINIDKEIYHILGSNKWSEAISILTSNALPFAQCPEEWKAIPPLFSYQKHLNNTHDKVLEKPAYKIIAKSGKTFDANVKSLIQSPSESVKLEVKNLGEIDILVLDEDIKKIWVIECKHNRSRFDVNNWRRDYSNFQNYEVKLRNKEFWCSKNRIKVQLHFNNKFNLAINILDWEVEGIFVINAPTLYMYNGNFRTFTLADFEKLMQGSYQQKAFIYEEEETGKEMIVEFPYFKNIRKNLAST